MLNDFRNKDFWVEKDNDKNKTYFIKMNGKWIEVSKEVYMTYKGSYQKMYRDYKRSSDDVEYNERIEELYLESKNPIDDIWLIYMKEILHKVMVDLTEEEWIIIQKLFYEEISERQLASKLGISKTALHYRKKKILNKLRYFLDQYE